MEGSSQKFIGRNRPPRVQITYDVQIGNAIEKKELPLVVGILADLAGANPNVPLMKKRKFVEIDRDNFDAVMQKIAPRVVVNVPNRLGDPKAPPSTMSVELEFKKFEDFRPEAIVRKVPALNALFEARQRLNDLTAKLDGNDALAALLQQVIANPAGQEEIKAEAAKSAAAATSKNEGGKANV
jgi:type VI secretion system protein ImpB